MVAGVKLPNGAWAAFSAARIPQILGDEMKGYCAHSFAAVKKLNRWPSRWRATSRSAS